MPVLLCSAFFLSIPHFFGELPFLACLVPWGQSTQGSPPPNYPRPYNERTVSPIVVIVGAGAGRMWGGDPCGRPVGTFKSPWIIRQQTLAVACCRLYNRMQPHQNGYHGAPGKDCR